MPFSAESHLPKDAPNILIILLDDVGFGLPDTFGGPVHTPTLSRLASDGISYNALPHDVDLLADARGAADRPQPSARRLRHDRRACASTGTAIPASSRARPRPLAEGAAATTATRPRPSANGTTRRPPRPRRWDRSTLWPTGDGRLRLFLRLPCRRNVAMGAAAVREPQSGRTAARRELSPHRRHGRQGDRLAAQARGLYARQAVPHVLGARARATVRITSSRNGRTSTKASSTTAGTRYRERDLRAAEGARLDSRRHQTDAARRDHGRVGQHSRLRKAFQTPADGDLRRLHRTCRRAGRPADRRA